MSTSDAIAAVTATLVHILENDRLDDRLGTIDAVPDTGAEVTTRPLDEAGQDIPAERGRINLFLYQTTINAAWRNMSIPHQTKPGELGHPPLALDLHYLLTAYGQNNGQHTDQRLLGLAMRILHDRAVLSPADIKNALGDSPPSHLDKQIERVRITPQPLSLDEMSKLWTIFQTQYRVSVTYQASVVLIESMRAVRTPVPVIRRGPKDEGVRSQPDLTSPVPTITRIELPNKQPRLQFHTLPPLPGQEEKRPADKLTIYGRHLGEDKLQVQFMHALLSEPIVVEVEDNPNEDSSTKASTIERNIPPQPDGATTRITIKLSKTAEVAEFLPGFYRVAVIVTQTEEQAEGEPVKREKPTNQQSFSLAPRITALALNPTKTQLSITCKPEVLWPTQSIFLLLGEHQIHPLKEPDPDPKNPIRLGTLKFDVTTLNLTPGREYLARLRIDGVDSLPVEDYEAKSLDFGDNQKVII